MRIMKNTHKFNRFTYSVDDQILIDKSPLIEVITEKNQSKPNFLSHYYRINQNSIESLLNHFIYASHPFEFNDPFDCNRELISFNNCSIDEILSIDKNLTNPDELKKLYRTNKRFLDDLLKWRIYDVLYLQKGIFCLTPIKDSMEMWSYYTNHRGFLIEFNCTELPSNHWGPFPINYTNQFKPLHYSIFKEYSFVYQANVKAKCWKHENEWRIIFYGPEFMKVPFKDRKNVHDRKFYYKPEAINQIILGFYFFEMSEYMPNKDLSSTEYVVELKTNIESKRQILNQIIKLAIPTSIINLKRKSSSRLNFRPIKVNELGSNRFKIKYVG